LIRLKKLFRNRNAIMILALFSGFLWPNAARFTEGITLPALALVMTLSTLGVSGSIFVSPRTLVRPILAGIGMNYLCLGGVLLGLAALMIEDPAIRSGFVLLAAVPPAVAVVPFTLFLKGNNMFSLVGTLGAYLGALVITPLMGAALLESGSIDPLKLLLIMVELILVPLVVSRILVWVKLAPRLEPIKGTITNWSFFILTYTIVGLNHEIFLRDPFFLLPVAIIAVATTFLLGWGIDRLGRTLRVEPGTLVSFVLLGTLKNYGLAGGLALALFSKVNAVPATVSMVFSIVYIIWLEFKKRKRDIGQTP
jgi:bile acid:Na+ symporter, BASS family